MGAQRSTRGKAKLDAQRIAQLESLAGWEWDLRDAWWEMGFAHLEEFVRHQRHARVPALFKAVDGFQLGAWVDRQRGMHGKIRRGKGKLSAERIARLEALPGWVWKAAN